MNPTIIRTLVLMFTFIIVPNYSAGMDDCKGTSVGSCNSVVLENPCDKYYTINIEEDFGEYCEEVKSGGSCTLPGSDSSTKCNLKYKELDTCVGTGVICLDITDAKECGTVDDPKEYQAPAQADTTSTIGSQCAIKNNEDCSPVGPACQYPLDT